MSQIVKYKNLFGWYCEDMYFDNDYSLKVEHLEKRDRVFTYYQGEEIEDARTFVDNEKLKKYIKEVKNYDKP